MRGLKVMTFGLIAFLAGAVLTHAIHERYAVPKVNLYTGVFDVRDAETGEPLKFSVTGPATYLGPDYFSPALFERPSGGLSMPSRGPCRITCMGVEPPSIKLECEGYHPKVAEISQVPNPTRTDDCTLSSEVYRVGPYPAKIVKLKRKSAEQKD